MREVRSRKDYMHFLSDELEPVLQEELRLFAGEVRSANPYSRWSNGLIRAIHAKNIAIVGEAFTWIDVMNCFDEMGEETGDTPYFRRKICWLKMGLSLEVMMVLIYAAVPML